MGVKPLEDGEVVGSMKIGVKKVKDGVKGDSTKTGVNSNQSELTSNDAETMLLNEMDQLINHPQKRRQCTTRVQRLQLQQLKKQHFHFL